MNLTSGGVQMSISKKSMIWTSIVIALFLVCLVYPGQVFGAIGKLISVLNPLILGGVMAMPLICCRVNWKSGCGRMPVKVGSGFTTAVGYFICTTHCCAGNCWVMRLVIPQFVDAINSFLRPYQVP